MVLQVAREEGFIEPAVKFLIFQRRPAPMGQV